MRISHRLICEANRSAGETDMLLLVRVLSVVFCSSCAFGTRPSRPSDVDDDDDDDDDGACKLILVFLRAPLRQGETSLLVRAHTRVFRSATTRGSAI